MIVGVVLVASVAFFLSRIAGDQQNSGPSDVSLQQSVPPVPNAGFLPANSSLDWLTYHRDMSHSGFLPVNVTSVHKGWMSDTLDGAIYAEPLVAGNRVLAVTENNSIYSLDARDGTIQWRVNVGAPVSGDSLPCGNINPSGITGTPVIDNSTRTLYAVAFLSKSMSHSLVGVNIDTGKLVVQRAIDPDDSNPLVQQQRGALAFERGMVYVPFGGLYGDCSNYVGWMVGMKSIDSREPLLTYRVPANREAGFWATPGAAIDKDGYLYVSSGNGDSITSYDHGNSIIKLSPGLKEVDSFATSDWARLNALDIDLGSVSPAIVGSHLLFQIGKAGTGYLINSSSLGGIGGEIYKQQICSGAYGGTAYSAPYLFVPCTDGIYVLRIGSNSFSVVWHSPQFKSGSPIVTGNLAWAFDLDSGTLHAFEITTGHDIFSYTLGSVPNFTTPAAGQGRVFSAAGDHRIVSFELS